MALRRYSPREVRLGERVEREHARSIRWLQHHPRASLKAATHRIALEHLRELPDYYSRLRRMERQTRTRRSR